MTSRKEKWFIEEISAWDMTSTIACLHLTNFKLPSHQEIEDILDKEISKLRWVKLIDAEVGLGKASGFLITTDDKKFQLVYKMLLINLFCNKRNYRRN